MDELSDKMDELSDKMDGFDSDNDSLYNDPLYGEPVPMEFSFVETPENESKRGKKREKISPLVGPEYVSESPEERQDNKQPRVPDKFDFPPARPHRGPGGIVNSFSPTTPVEKSSGRKKRPSYK